MSTYIFPKLLHCTVLMLLLMRTKYVTSDVSFDSITEMKEYCASLQGFINDAGSYYLLDVFSNIHATFIKQLDLFYQRCT